MGFFSIIIMVVYMDKNVEDYLDYLSYQKGYSKYTIKNYEEDILSNNGVVQHIRSGDSL